jgi:hypothetical protein
MIYKESYIRASLYCPALPGLNGVIDKLEQSQRIFIAVIKDLNLLTIKGELADLDEDLYKSIKARLSEFYPKVSSDDAQTCINYVVSGFYAYLKLFPLEKYRPIIIDYTPSVRLNGNSVELHYDLLLQQTNKSQFLHGVCFVDKLDKHSGELDLFNYLKLKFLSTTYKKKRKTHPPVKLHVLCLPNLTYRNKNFRSHLLRSFTVTERDVTKNHLTAISRLIEWSLSNTYPVPIPGCKKYSCPKRQECNFDYREKK